MLWVFPEWYPGQATFQLKFFFEFEFILWFSLCFYFVMWIFRCSQWDCRASVKVTLLTTADAQSLNGCTIKKYVSVSLAPGRVQNANRVLERIILFGYNHCSCPNTRTMSCANYFYKHCVNIPMNNWILGWGLAIVGAMESHYPHRHPIGPLRACTTLLMSLEWGLRVPVIGTTQILRRFWLVPMIL